MLAVCACLTLPVRCENLNIPPVDLTWTILYDAAGEWNHDTPLKFFFHVHRMRSGLFYEATSENSTELDEVGCIYEKIDPVLRGWVTSQPCSYHSLSWNRWLSICWPLQETVSILLYGVSLFLENWASVYVHACVLFLFRCECVCIGLNLYLYVNVSGSVSICVSVSLSLSMCVCVSVCKMSSSISMNDS